MKKTQLFLLAWLTCFFAFGQTSEYKKILESRNSLTFDEFYASLQAFQKDNVKFSNVYFQIGEIDQKSFSELDPIVNRSGSRQYIHNAEINYGLSKSFIDPKEAAKNSAWYSIAKIKDKDSLAIMVSNHVNGKYESTVAYSEAYEKLIENYDKAIANYLRARQKFIDINNSANNLRELFLVADDSLKQAVKEIGIDFDSSIYHLDIYRSTYQKLPYIKKREVNVTLQKINHFRMNGITPSNFLADDISLWNYGEWSKNFSVLLEEEVDGLRKEVEEAYSFFHATNVKMMTGDDCIQATIDDLKLQRIINLITKYDNQSVLIDIFNYLTSKLEYGNQLVFERNCNIIESLPTDDLLSRKVRAFQTIYNDLLKSDSVCQIIGNTTKNQKNFGWFFDQYMSGTTGVSSFSNNQIKENNLAFTTEIGRFRELVNLQFLNTDSIGNCYQLEDSILIAEPINPTGQSVCIIKKISINNDTEIGILLKDGKYSIASLRADDLDYINLWEHSTRSPIEFFKVLTDSSFIIGSYTGKAWLKHIYTNGEVKSDIKLRSTDTIRNIYYNDLQGEYTIVSGKYNETTNDGYKISVLSFNGKLKSTKKLSLVGEFVNLFVTDQKYWVFSKSHGEIGSLITAVVLGKDFVMQGEAINYSFMNDFDSTLVIKNDDKTITVIGNNLENESRLLYALIDYQGNIEHEKIF